MKKNILLISEGNNTEHEVSLRSAEHFKNTLSHLGHYILTEVIIGKDSIPRFKSNNEATTYENIFKGIGNVKSLFRSSDHYFYRRCLQTP